MAWRGYTEDTLIELPVIYLDKLRGAIHSALESMVRLNRTRVDYLEKFQQMIDEYNQGAANLEEFFERLLKFVKELQEEEKRGVSGGLSEEELAEDTGETSGCHGYGERQTQRTA